MKQLAPGCGESNDSAHCVEFRRACGQLGFDLVQPLRVRWYNEAVSSELRLDELGNPDHCAYVVGNSRALWPIFLAARSSSSVLQASENPLDDYTAQSISKVLSALQVEYSVRWAHQGGHRTVAMQRLAEVAGLAYTAPSYLSIHAQLGPWLGLRAAVVVALPGPSGSAPSLASPCNSCRHSCEPALREALRVSQLVPGSRLDQASIEANFPYWLRCREACPIGKEFRYSDAQIRYHYLKDRSALDAVPDICS